MKMLIQIFRAQALIYPIFEEWLAIHMPSIEEYAQQQNLRLRTSEDLFLAIESLAEVKRNRYLKVFIEPYANERIPVGVRQMGDYTEPSGDNWNSDMTVSKIDTRIIEMERGMERRVLTRELPTPAKFQISLVRSES